MVKIKYSIDDVQETYLAKHMQKHADRVDKRPPITAGPGHSGMGGLGDPYWPKMDPMAAMYGYQPGLAEHRLELERDQGYSVAGWDPRYTLYFTLNIVHNAPLHTAHYTLHHSTLRTTHCRLRTTVLHTMHYTLHITYYTLYLHLYISRNSSAFSALQPPVTSVHSAITGHKTSYDLTKPSQSYDLTKPSQSYDLTKPSQSYDLTKPSQSYDLTKPSQSYDPAQFLAKAPVQHTSVQQESKASLISLAR